MAKRQLPSPETLRQLLRYEPETGKLFWRDRGLEWFSDGKWTAERIAKGWNAKNAGKEASSEMNSGYLSVTLLGKSNLLSHRVIMAIINNEWPDADVDHINMDRKDNRIINLRLATRSQNRMNTRKPSTNTSGHKGVSFDKRKRKWAASIKRNGIQKNLGYFDKPEDAHNAYCKASEVIFGEFSRTD